MVKSDVSMLLPDLRSEFEVNTARDRAKSHSITKQHLEKHILPSVITLVLTNDWSRHLLLESACMNETRGEQTEFEANALNN